MKILLCNIPIRPEPTHFPPVSCTSLLKVLIKNGYNASFYDIDVRRPSFVELSEFFSSENFDIVGISAVVSTGYRASKDLSKLIKKVSPKTKIILGGNLAAAYDIILRKCDIDICVIGEGEKVLLELVKHYEKYGNFNSNNSALSTIKSIAFMDSGSRIKFTGQRERDNNHYITQSDYELLEKFSKIDNYIVDPMIREDFACDVRSHEVSRQGKKMATIFTSKGCINKCTFCHRWAEGYRISPIEQVIDTIKNLIYKYNIGFFCICDECFGENKLWLDEFIKQVKPLDILFQVAGARVSMVKKDPAILNRLKEAGLTAIYFGLESGSNKILNVMEKNATVAENLAASKICLDAGIFTIIQLVIGMPGENEETINETIDFVKKATVNWLHPPYVHINYLQALPGTPSYEFLRKKGLLGTTIDDEEQYLLNVSDIDAHDFKQYINVSEEPLSKVALWQKKIYLSSRLYWFKSNRHWLLGQKNNKEKRKKGAKQLILSKLKYIIFTCKFIPYGLIHFIENLVWKPLIIKQRHSLYGVKRACLITLGLIQEEDRSPFKIENCSLRKIVEK